MRYLVIADIHGNYQALQKVFDQVDYDTPFIFAGDLMDYGGNPLDCARLLDSKPMVSIPHSILEINPPHLGCLGNHDIAIMNSDYSRFRTEHGKKSAKWSTERYEQSPTIQEFLEQKFIDEFEGLKICHGSDIDPWKNVFINDTETMDAMIERNPDIDLFIIAHSHLQFIKQYRGKIFLNPGSVGQSRNGIPKAHYAIIETPFTDTDFRKNLKITLHSVGYNIDEAAKEISENPELDNFLATRLYLGI